MKPLPAQRTKFTIEDDGKLPSLPLSLDRPTPSSVSTGNRRVSSPSVLRIYPLLLFTSTAIAGIFCFMYITKPFIQASQATSNPSFLKSLSFPSFSSTKTVPEEVKPASQVSNDAGISSHSTPAPPAFEKTNLRIQHNLTAEAPGGFQSKIDIDVPVLYQSRNLRWTSDEVAKARILLVQLANYQEKCRALRTEGSEILQSWNQLIEQSTPTAGLRADSPSLPSNQQDAANAPRPVDLDTSNLIRIQPSSK